MCDSALSLPGNYKAHVRMFHGNERSNDRIFPPLKKTGLPSIEEEYCSTADTSSSDLQWPLGIDDLGHRERERDGYGVDMLGVITVNSLYCQLVLLLLTQGQFLEWRVMHGNNILPPITPRGTY